ncbi:TPA: acyltransferase [Enterobacter ludwigii]|uniref:acyltransferase family protein n=1 Tax=Enterobacter ludwigii TaxID=299767 RepID=UPI0020267B02|nr:acyltransferase [Enterobacter ludwigii]MCL9630865.1 acyltransferase [Enterobacter ludwigii]HDR2537679.1 acyltransferase [Enterobacter ludwigii]
MSYRNNSFNFIRHFAAFMVLFSHNFALNGLSEPIIRSWDTLGFFAVITFFSISGYLMPSSYSSSKNIFHFFEKRLRRLLPAIVVCSFIMIFIISPLFSNADYLSYEMIKESVRLFVQHCVFVFNNPTGVFYDFKVNGAMNGSLWTIPVEIFCYIIFSISMTFRNDYKTALTLLLVSLAGCFLSIYNEIDFVFYGVPLKYLSMFGVAFTTGALLSMTQSVWFSYRKAMIIASIALIISAQTGLELNSICLIALSALVVILGLSFKTNKFNNIDISYGVYIYAFPVQQIIINKVSDNFITSLMLSSAITVVLAYASFKFVERPFLLRFKKHHKPDVIERFNS